MKQSLTAILAFVLCLLKINEINAQIDPLPSDASPFERFLYEHPFSNRPNLSKAEIRQMATKDRPHYYQEREFLMTVDPNTLVLPQEEFNKANAETRIASRRVGRAAIPGVVWTERGPNNVGGRTRAIMFDPNDATKKKLWAGGVAGGLWYNNDITVNTSSWQKVDDFWANLAVGAMAYDPQNSQIMYVGTGEFTFNADRVLGGGIWRTTNGGTTWTQLANTIPSGSSGDFVAVAKIVVNARGSVFAATNAGIFKSINKGVTWTRVLAPSAGIGITTIASYNNYASDLEIGTDGILYVGLGYNSMGRSFKSTDSTGTAYTDITPLPTLTNEGRIEIALDPSTSGTTQVVYEIAENKTNGTALWMRRSADAGVTWTVITTPTYASPGTGDFTSGQGWYDLIMTVHPTNGSIFAGGTSWFRSTNNGTSWTELSAYGQYIHPDQHNMIFRPGFNNTAVFANDGGLYYAPDVTAASSSSFFQVRNKDYNTSQFYSVAIKNIAGSNYLLGGTQDNGTWYLNGAGISPGFTVGGGDGMIAGIDQDDSGVQYGSYQNGVFYLVNRDGVMQNQLPLTGGLFVDPTAYDSKHNVLFSPVGTTTFTSLQRVIGVGFTNTGVTMTLGGTNVASRITALTMGVTDHVLFIGTLGGRVYKLTNVNTAAATATRIDNPSNPSGTPLPSGAVTHIEVGTTDNELLVTFSNYGIFSVWYSTDGGATWINKDDAGHGLPNIPVRWALMNPQDRKQVMLATDSGIWSTNDITASNPAWQVSNTGLANVRCEMLAYRDADGTVAVGTHGRGIFTTNVFAKSNTISVMMPAYNIISCDAATTFPVRLNFTTTGTFNAGNVFTVELSTADGRFIAPTAYGMVVANNINYIYIPTSVGAGKYQVRIKSSNPVAEGYGDFYLIKECNYTNPSASDCTDGDEIRNVVLKQGATTLISNTTNACSVNGYGDFTGTVAAATLTSGQTYNLSVTNSGAYYEGIGVWIDYNRDNFFSDSEKVISQGGFVTNAASFVVPNTGIVNGAARMRIVQAYNTFPVSNPYGAGSYGEVEDYAVNLVGPGTIQSAKSGNWDNPTTWMCNCVPAVTDDVYISPNHFVFINGITARAKKVVYSGGTLFMTNGGILRY